MGHNFRLLRKRQDFEYGDYMTRDDVSISVGLTHVVVLI